MIHINNKQDCCGCGACAQKCPKQCITMQEDSEGFLYPKVDEDTCIGCGLCEKVCSAINQTNAGNILGVYAAKNDNEEIRMQSSSGGIFSSLAEFVIDEGGVVFGASFNKDWDVEHTYSESKEGLAVFRGSKYVQSVVGNTYEEAEQFLKEGRKVLYSGTPCQIAGLKHFLRKEYDNLLSVECVCHSVPSPLVWQKYLEQHSKGRSVKSVNFRDKSTGWSKYKYSLVIEYENGDKETVPGGQPYMRALVNNLTTRPSCATCWSREGRSGADVSLGDFWGIWDIFPELDDNKGYTLVVAHSEKGIAALKDIEGQEVSLIEARKYNGGLLSPKPLHNKRNLFFFSLSSTMNVDALIERSLHISLLTRIKRKLRIK